MCGALIPVFKPNMTKFQCLNSNPILILYCFASSKSQSHFPAKIHVDPSFYFTLQDPLSYNRIEHFLLTNFFIVVNNFKQYCFACIRCENAKKFC